MGDPGVPVMLSLLAVPVGVLLFVVTLALMGRRWEALAPLGGPGLADETAPFDDSWLYEEPPRYEEPPMYNPPRAYEEPRAYNPPRAVEEARPMPDRALPAPRARLALPPARPQYGAFSRGAYERPAEPDPESSSQQSFPYGPYRNH